jgi:hypothetical protein
LLFGGAEGVLAQDPMTGVIGSLDARHFGAVRCARRANLKYNPLHSRTTSRARARWPIYRTAPIAGVALF